MGSHNHFWPMPTKTNPDQFILSTLLYYWKCLLNLLFLGFHLQPETVFGVPPESQTGLYSIKVWSQSCYDLTCVMISRLRPHSRQPFLRI